MERDRAAARVPFGRLLRRYRLAAGLSQEALAERAGLSWRTVSDLERGVKQGPRGSTARLLADALALGAEDRAALLASAFPQEVAAAGQAPLAPAQQPPARPATVPTNLSLALTSFVGRERELAAVRRLLGETRLLTLVGAGGCGKTRLAIEVARALAREAGAADVCADGIWLVELAALGQGALVPRAVAAALGVREQPGQALPDTLTAFLQPKQLLLVLDNCEHLVLACAELAEVLLRACPAVRILATSREALGVGGERPWRVPSLRLAEPAAPDVPERVLACEAVQLFVQRAQVVRPELALSGQQVELVAEVCSRLDGIPLAIELAAARLASLSLDQLAARLEDRFRLLKGGSRTVLPRQQTLRATLDWSHDLLSAPERVLLRRLSVFAGGWTLEAAEAACSGGGMAQEEVLDLLAGLVGKSLVLLQEARAGARYGLLETVRQYGWEKLEAAGEASLLRDRHLDWYLALANQAAQRIGGAEREVWLERLEVELENLRAALRWSSTHEGRQEAGLRLAAALEDFWYIRGYTGEGRRWLEDLLERGGATSTALRARALEVLGLLAFYQGDHAQSLTLFEAAYALHRSEGNEHSATWALNYQGLIAIVLGDYQRATTLLEQVLPAHREQGDQHGVGWALCYLADIRQVQGDYTRAVALYEESLAVFQELGDKYGIGHQLRHLASAAWDLGSYGQAKRLYRESLHVRRSLMDRGGCADCFEGLAIVAAAEGQPSRAARLIGAAKCLREATGTPGPLLNRTAYTRAVDGVHSALGEDTFAAAWAEGQAMGLEEAIAYALQEANPA